MVVVDRLSKYAHFIFLSHPYTASSVARVFLDQIFKLMAYHHQLLVTEIQPSLADSGGNYSNYKGLNWNIAQHTTLKMMDSPKWWIDAWRISSDVSWDLGQRTGLNSYPWRSGGITPISTLLQACLHSKLSMDIHPRDFYPTSQEQLGTKL